MENRKHAAKLAKDLEEAYEKIAELESELKDVGVREFCYDLQVWVKDKIQGIDCFKNYFAYQDIRKAVYSEMIADGKTPTWGDESYYSEKYANKPKLGRFEYEDQIEELRKRLDIAIECIEYYSFDGSWTTDIGMKIYDSIDWADVGKSERHECIGGKKARETLAKIREGKPDIAETSEIDWSKQCYHNGHGDSKPLINK